MTTQQPDKSVKVLMAEFYGIDKQNVSPTLCGAFFMEINKRKKENEENYNKRISKYGASR